MWPEQRQQGEWLKPSKSTGGRRELAAQTAKTLDFINVTKTHLKDASAQRLLPYSGLFLNPQDFLQTQPQVPET